MAENPYDIEQIFSEIEQDLIGSMYRSMKQNGFHRLEEMHEGFQWTQWQAIQLRDMERFRKQNSRYFRGKSKHIDDTVRQHIEDEFRQAGQAEAFRIREAIKRGHSIPRRQIPGNESWFGINDEMLNALIKSSRRDLGNASYNALRQIDDIYRQIPFRAQVFINTGAKTVPQAIDMATRDFLSRGLNKITLGGRNLNIASYAEMVIRTSETRAYLMGGGAKRAEFGESLVIVSQYAGSSPTCQPWQGKVYIDDVYSGGKANDYGGRYPLLSTAIKAGLFHPNCRHICTSFFEDINEQPPPIDRERATEIYNKEQKQRHNERQIRKYKRLQDGSLDPENKARYGQKVKEWTDRNKEFVEKNNSVLRRDKWRERYVKAPTSETAPNSTPQPVIQRENAK